MPENRLRDPMLAREAIDAAFKTAVDAAFHLAIVDSLSEASKQKFAKAVNSAMDMRQWALDVFVNGTKQV